MFANSVNSQSMDSRIDAALYAAKYQGHSTAPIHIEFNCDSRGLQLSMVQRINWLDNGGKFASGILELAKLDDLAAIGEVARVEMKKPMQPHCQIPGTR